MVKWSVLQNAVQTCRSLVNRVKSNDQIKFLAHLPIVNTMFNFKVAALSGFLVNNFDFFVSFLNKVV